MELVTVPNVHLARTGTWGASTGVTTFTRDDFEHAVAASADPEVWDAPVKLGHVDSDKNDGDPAYGWVTNLRVVAGDGGDDLYGDLVGVPRPLAAIMPSAYRQRSIELAWGVRTPSGRRYKAAIIGLALLGAVRPAITGLADLEGVLEGRIPISLAGARPGTVAEQVWTTVYEGATAVASWAGAGVSALPPPLRGDTGPDGPPGGPPMPPLTDARIREVFGLQAHDDLEAELVRWRNRAAFASAAGTPAPAPPPGAFPFLPAGYVPAGPQFLGAPAYAAGPPAPAPATGYGVAGSPLGPPAPQGASPLANDGAGTPWGSTTTPAGSPLSPLANAGNGPPPGWGPPAAPQGYAPPAPPQAPAYAPAPQMLPSGAWPAQAPAPAPAPAYAYGPPAAPQAYAPPPAPQVPTWPAPLPPAPQAYASPAPPPAPQGYGPPPGPPGYAPPAWGPAPAPAPTGYGPPPAPYAPAPALPGPPAPGPQPGPTWPGQAGLMPADPALLQNLVTQAAAGASAAETLRVRDRESLLAAHATAGRIAPHALQQWRTSYDANPAGTVALLSTLPTAFPVTLAGSGEPAAPASADGVDESALHGFYASQGWGDVLPPAPVAPAGYVPAGYVPAGPPPPAPAWPAGY